MSITSLQFLILEEMISKPLTNEVTPALQGYINTADDEDLLVSLDTTLEETVSLLNNLSEQAANYAYAADKWSIKEVISHLIDTERVFSYRALAFSRQEQQSLPSFDENQYVLHSNAGNLPLTELLDELMFIRKATIRLYLHMKPEALDDKGVANGNPATARAMGWAIAGHNRHHLNILKERYLVQLEH